MIVDDYDYVHPSTRAGFHVPCKPSAWIIPSVFVYLTMCLYLGWVSLLGTGCYLFFYNENVRC
jgi:hypothetical protein